MGIILEPIALFLFLLSYAVHGVAMLFINVYKRKWLKVTIERKFSKSLKTDVLGNFLFADLWNVIFSTGGYQFGKFGETISSVLGRKYLKGTLTWFGLFWYYLLYAIDIPKWKKQGHCIASIQTQDQINNFLKRE
jgi:hypothetical protein